MPSPCFERILPVDSVLIVDDDRDDLEALAEVCRPRTTWVTADVNEAFEIAKRERPQLAIIDLWLGAQNAAPQLSHKWLREVFGIDVIRQLHEDYPEMIVVLFSRSVSEAHRTAALAAGAAGAVPKLFGPKQLMMIVEGGHLEVPQKRSKPTLAMKIHDYTAERYHANGRNAAATAKELGISVSKLYRQLRGTVPER